MREFQPYWGHRLTFQISALNLFAVRFYGGAKMACCKRSGFLTHLCWPESEFWLALGKVVLIFGLILFTFVVMVGGNPAVRI
jgi:hypothetical protein